MRRIRGTAAGHVLVKDQGVANRAELARRLGQELARIHSVRPPNTALNFMPLHDEPPAAHSVKQYWSFLDRHHTPYPALEWGLRWLERHAPPRVCSP